MCVAAVDADGRICRRRYREHATPGPDRDASSTDPGGEDAAPRPPGTPAEVCVLDSRRIAQLQPCPLTGAPHHEQAQGLRGLQAEGPRDQPVAIGGDAKAIAAATRPVRRLPERLVA